MRNTFLNGDEKLKEKGKQTLYSTLEDLEFYSKYYHCENLEELIEEMRRNDMGNSSITECREVIRQFEYLGSFYDYALCIDFVEDDEDENYFRYQMSWGGPSDEIRFYENGQIEYVFLDWFVGVGFDISDEESAIWLRDWLVEVGSLDFENKHEIYGR